MTSPLSVLEIKGFDYNTSMSLVFDIYILQYILNMILIPLMSHMQDKESLMSSPV